MPELPHPVVDSDTFAPTISEREDCGNPHGCICPADEDCQWPKLANVPRPDRSEEEWPTHGE